MPADQRKHLSRSREITIDPALLAEFRALHDTKIGQRGRTWTPQEDELLMLFWPWKEKGQVARKIGCHETTARIRYRLLLQEQPERVKALAEEGKRLCSQ